MTLRSAGAMADPGAGCSIRPFADDFTAPTPAIDARSVDLQPPPRSIMARAVDPAIATSRDPRSLGRVGRKKSADQQSRRRFALNFWPRADCSVESGDSCRAKSPSVGAPGKSRRQRLGFRFLDRDRDLAGGLARGTGLGFQVATCRVDALQLVVGHGP